MKILSMQWGTCSTAAVVIDGRVEACVSEERFSRIKNDESYPLHAVESVLAETGVDPLELDLVVIGGKRFDAKAVLCRKYSTFSVRDRLREQYEYWLPVMGGEKNVFYPEVFKDKVDTKQYPGKWKDVVRFLNRRDQSSADPFFQDFIRSVINNHIGVDMKKIVFMNHHYSHACYAYYASPVRDDKVLLLTADAWGDTANATVSFIRKGNIDLVSSSDNFIVGRLYRHMTLLLGMKPDEHEYKVMGLAAYSRRDYYKDALEVFRNTMYVDGLKFAYHKKPPDLYFYFKGKLEGMRFDSIAGALQNYAEEILTAWVRNALKASGARKVCLGGGVAMNIKAMMEVAKLPELDDIFICPTPSDESLAIGAAYAAMHDLYTARGEDPRDHIKPLDDAYLGPAAKRGDIESVRRHAQRKGYKVRSRPAAEYVARLINKGGIIGRCAGRSEFGARALGNRSILADPRKINSIKIINEKIKCRDFWMPFAPSILAERADSYLVNPKKIRSPYMTIAFETKPRAAEDLKAALHQYDMTVRPQVVSKDQNPQYHDLISSFYRMTGVGGVLNTSFNIHGEPIVQTPQDAFRVFEKTSLDSLLLDDCIIERVTKKGEGSGNG